MLVLRQSIITREVDVDKHITIDFQYDKITLDFKLPKLKAPLDDEWAALTREEQRLYRNTGSPTYGWTDVMEQEDSWFIKEMWDQCASYIEHGEPGWDTFSRDAQCRLVARRVARMNALMVYGPEYLLI